MVSSLGIGCGIVGGGGGGRLQVRHGRGERGGLWRCGLLLCRKWRWRFAWFVVLRGRGGGGMGGGGRGGKEEMYGY